MPMAEPALSLSASVPLMEFQHYVRNLLAIVRSLVRRSAHAAMSVEDVCGALDGRIGALGRAQAHLARDPMRGTDFETILRDELLAYRLHAGNAVTLEGPALPLPWRAATTMTLAIHELLTNAIRHGALTDGNGHLAVTWRLRDDRRTVEVRWIERFGTRPPAPSPRGGFGWEFLEGTLAYDLDADVRLALDPRGFRCDISFALAA